MYLRSFRFAPVPIQTKHELPTMYLFLYLAVFDIPSSSQVLHRQRSQSSLLLLGNSTGPSVHP